MSAWDSKCREIRRWKALYRAVICTPNIRKNPNTITDAEDAIIARARELRYQSGPEVDSEREDLDDALYALRALRNTVTFATAA
jgi:hypothetical protein